MVCTDSDGGDRREDVVRASAVAAPAADGEECWSLATTTSDFLHIEVLEFFGDKTAARCCEEGYRLECRAVGPAYASSVAAACSGEELEWECLTATI